MHQLRIDNTCDIDRKGRFERNSWRVLIDSVLPDRQSIDLITDEMHFVLLAQLHQGDENTPRVAASQRVVRMTDDQTCNSSPLRLSIENNSFVLSYRVLTNGVD